MPAVLASLVAFGAGAQRQFHTAKKQLTTPTPPNPPSEDGDSLPADFVLPPPPPEPKWGFYQQIENIGGNWVNMNPIPIRPMTFAASGTSLFACNPYNSEVSRIDASLTVVDTFRTLWGPVAIANYNDGTDDLLLVVCQHSNAVVVQDESGEIRRIVTVRPEPADIVVDQANNRAFVSCAGTSEVVEIDTTTWDIAQTYAIPSSTPMFLEITPAGDVFVAPRWSGNNSAVHRFPQKHNPNANSLNVVDLADPDVADVGLPDEDLFWLNRSSGQAEAIVSGTGSILLAHGVNPDTGRYWQLNTEANNKDPNAQRVDLIRGNVSFNRLTIFDLPALGSGTVVTPAPIDIIDLDDTDPSTSGIQFTPGASVGIPYSLAFSQLGHAYVVGKLSDNIVLLDKQGQRVAEFDLPPGSYTPRQALIDATETFLAVWSSDNTVHVYSIVNPVAPALLQSVSVGYDPTPPDIRDGRRLFFDGTFSEHGNASCATCHDEGKHDMLAWSLGSTKDDKGAMVTQTLVGINRSTPFHWRGEQLNNLADFNAAFEDLLGGAKMGTGAGSDFEKFEKFVLSLTNPANPFQHRDRILDASIEPPMLLPGVDSNAVLGQKEFMARCERCHGMPTGTNNNMVNDGAVFQEPIPRRQFIKIAGFQSIPYRGWQPKVNVTWDPTHPELGPVGTQEYPLLGVGTAHAGNPANIPDFIDFFDDEGTKKHAHLTAFIHQFDQGVAPAVHSHFLLNSATTGDVFTELLQHLFPQASQRNCDVAVFGRTTIDSVDRIWSWYYSPGSALFIRDDAAVTSADFFINQVTANPDDWFAFVGLPVGMGVPFSMDKDNDLYPSGLEADDYNVDSDGDGDWDGHEWFNGGDPHDDMVQANDSTPPGLLGPFGGSINLQWTTSNSARLTFETDELTTFSLTYDSGFTPFLPLITHTETEFKWVHDVVLPGFFFGLDYTGTITLTDLAGLTTTLPLPVAEIEPGQILPSTVLVNDLQAVGPLAQTGTTTRFQASVNIVRRDSLGAVADHIVVARVFRDDVAAAAVGGTATSFKVNGVTYAAIPEPFVISKALTDSNGDTTLSFTLQNVGANEKIDLVIEAVGPAFDPDNYDPNDPDMAGAQAGLTPPFPANWNLPNTLARNRAINLK